MYNDHNVQPQMFNTGHGGSDVGEPKAPAQSVSPNELPTPTPGGMGSAPASPLPTSVTQPPVGASASPNSDQHWVDEVEQLFNRTLQTPRQRAEELNELRRRYQQDVLGLKQKEWEG